MDRSIVRRIGGAAAAILLLAGATVWFKAVNGPAAGTIRVNAVLGRAGSGVNQDTDVKARGVRIGKVVEISFVEGEARAVLEVENDPRLPAAEDLELFVTPKTFLGEKQVEINFADERFGQPPFLEPGSTLVADKPPIEVQEIVDTLEPVFAAIDENDLAALIEAFGEQQGEGEAIAENIDLSIELAQFGSRTADAQLENFERLADLAEGLAPHVDDFNRFNRDLENWITLIEDRQADLRANLDALTIFSIGFAEFLEVNERDIRTLMSVGNVVGGVFDRQMESIGEIVFGLYRYSNALGHHGGNLTDGSEFGLFRNFLKGEDIQSEICEQMGPIGEQFPQCAGGGA